MMPLSAGPLAFAALVGAQTIGAAVLLRHGVPVFARLAEEIGEPQRIPLATALWTLAAAAAMQGVYWFRLLRVPVAAPCRSRFLGHLALFAGRLSFVFGGALFSVVFFRHLPALGRASDVPLQIWQGGLLLTILFALFCYALELERLGNALQSPD